MIENDKVGDVFYKYRHSRSPTHWDVADCSPRKESPGRGTPLGEKFLELLVKINDLFMRIIIVL